MNREEALNLKPGQILYHKFNKNADGTRQRWKVNGKPRTWKRDPNRIEIPVKHGLYSYDTITQYDLEIVDISP